MKWFKLCLTSISIITPVATVISCESADYNFIPLKTSQYIDINDKVLIGEIKTISFRKNNIILIDYAYGHYRLHMKYNDKTTTYYVDNRHKREIERRFFNTNNR